MTPIQEDVLSTNLQQKDTAKSIMWETLKKDIGANKNDRLNNNEEEKEEQVNGFELFMLNARGNFNRSTGCGG